jgi:hypothetical protein
MPQVKTSLIMSRIMKAPMAKPKRERKDGSDPIDRLRAICLALPETTEKIAWGEPTFRVRGKLFAQLDNHHHGADHLAVWLPMPLGAQESLVYMDPVRYFVPPYVGGRGWVGVRIDRRPNWKTIGDLVREAYCTVAPARLAAPLRSVSTAQKQGLRRAR